MSDVPHHQPDTEIHSAPGTKTDAEIQKQEEKGQSIPAPQQEQSRGMTRRELGIGFISAGVALILENSLRWGCAVRHDSNAAAEKLAIDRQDMEQAEENLRGLENSMPNWINEAGRIVERNDRRLHLQMLRNHVWTHRRTVERLPFQNRDPLRVRLLRLELLVQNALDQDR